MDFREFRGEGGTMDVCCLASIKEKDVSSLELQVLELSVRAALASLDAEKDAVIPLAESGRGQSGTN